MWFINYWDIKTINDKKYSVKHFMNVNLFIINITVTNILCKNNYSVVNYIIKLKTEIHMCTEIVFKFQPVQNILYHTF